MPLWKELTWHSSGRPGSYTLLRTLTDHKSIMWDADTESAHHPGWDHQRVRPDRECGAHAVLSEPRGSPNQSAVQVAGLGKGRRRTGTCELRRGVHRQNGHPGINRTLYFARLVDPHVSQEGCKIHCKSLRDLPVNQPSTCPLEEREAERGEQLDQASDGQWRAFFDAHRLRSI